MSQTIYRGNLKSSSFPFLSDLFGRSVIVRQQDQNYVNGLAAKESIDSSLGIPQIYFCENVVPTDSGYKSVGYSEYTPDQFPSGVSVRQVITLRDGDGNTDLLAITAVGNLYVMQEGSSTWTIPSNPPSALVVATTRITAAYVQGVTYLYFSGDSCWKYDHGTNAFVSVTLAGLNPAVIIGIIGNHGYLIAYSSTGLAWSSTTDPTDFVPSLVTGAGDGQVEGLKGNIVHCETVYGGMIVFAEENSVGAIYSGNARYPYTFTEITGAGGLGDPSYVTSDVNTGTLYAYTTCGMQQISLRSASVLFPELADFLSGSLLEEYNYATNEIVPVSTAGTVIKKRFTVVANRYFIVSYGATELTHALYYDLSYKQWGKLQVTHTDCFEFVRAGTEIPKKSVAFVSATGRIQVLNTDIEAPNSSGVLYLGKFQYMRARLITLDRICLENIPLSSSPDVSVLTTLNGKTVALTKSAYLKESSGYYREYATHVTGMNHTIRIVGNFNLVSIELGFHNSGVR